MPEERFGPYRLEGLIGRGGMGEVYRAFDVVKKREVALKRLPPPLATDTEFQARFRRESELVARLVDPHVVPVYDYGEIDGQLFIEMRLVEGTDLAGLLSSTGPLPPVRAVEIISQVAGALDSAHALGLVHRDVKPSNVLLTRRDNGEEFVYLSDFGIARALAGATSLTMTGATVGTLAYMAPERFTGHGDDLCIDVYALTCLLYECLTAQPPFTGEGLPALMYAHLNTEPPKPSEHQSGVPADLDTVITRGMAKQPEQRYPSAGALAAAARTALTGTAAPVPTGAIRTPANTTPTAAELDTIVPPSPPPAVETIHGPHRPQATPESRMGTTDRRRRRHRVLLATTAVIIAMVTTAFLLLNQADNRLGSPSATAPRGTDVTGLSGTDVTAPSGAGITALTGSGVTRLSDIFGPACDQLPAAGQGSPQDMVNNPVALAVSHNPLLTTFTRLVSTATLGDTLNSAPSLTVFAPADLAFQALEAQHPGTLNQLTSASDVASPNSRLAKVLTYHVVGQRYDAAGIVQVGTLDSLEGWMIKIGGTATAPTVNGAPVLCGNIPTKNATVFIIGQVLSPPA